MHGHLATRAGARTILDVAVALLAFAGTLMQLRHGGIASGEPIQRLDPAGVLLAAGATLPLVLWRRQPYGVFVLTAAAGIVMAGRGLAADLLIGPAVALYLLAASRGRETPWTRSTAGSVAGMLAGYLVAAGVAHGAFPGIELLHTGLAWGVAWFAGERTRLRREHLTELRQRAVRAEQDAERERQLAVAEERARIARDLHDSAGHAISVIAVRAGAARLRQDPVRSQATLEAIELLARQTVDELDRTVQSIRAGGADRIEAPTGLASLSTLVGQHSAAGLAVTVGTTGTVRQLARGTDQAAYRILQEALTNAARHGSGGARVEIAYGEGTVALTVTNPVTGDGDPRIGGGHGLIGMRERATLAGGTLEAERLDGQFRVHLCLPDGRGGR